MVQSAGGKLPFLICLIAWMKWTSDTVLFGTKMNQSEMVLFQENSSVV